MENQEFPKPKTSQEAMNMIDACIESGNFELIDYYQREYESLLNYESVLKLGSKVNSYLQQNVKQTKDVTTTYEFSEQQLKIAKHKAAETFKRDYNKLKEQQQQELDDLLEEWENERNTHQDFANIEFQRAMTTAKILAKQNKVQEAIEIRDLASQKKDMVDVDYKKNVDSKFKRVVAEMTERHRTELENLYEQRRAELNSFDLVKKNMQNEAEANFLVNNATAVVDISRHFEKTAAMPKSFKMQAVKTRPKMDPSQQSYNALVSSGIL